MVLACVACLVAFVRDPHDELAAPDAVDLTASPLGLAAGVAHLLALRGCWG